MIRPLLRNEVMVESEMAMKKRYTQVVDESIGRMMNGGLAVLISVASVYTWLFVYFVTLEEQNKHLWANIMLIIIMYAGP